MRNAQSLPPERAARRCTRDGHQWLDTLPVPAYTCDADGLITCFNRHAEQFWGRAPRLNDAADRFCGSYRLFAADGAPIPVERCWMALALEQDRAYKDLEVVFERPDGVRRTGLVHISPLHNDAGKLTGAVNVILDITECKKREQARQRSEERLRTFEAALHGVNRALRMISGCNQALLHATDETAFLQEVCRIAVDVGGYEVAWVGKAEYDTEQSVRAVALVGRPPGFVESLNLTWADVPRGRGPTGVAIRTGEMCVVPDVRSDPRMEPWHEIAVREVHVAACALPLQAEDRTYGAFVIYSREHHSFTADELALLRDLADDLSYGITVLRTRQARTRAEEAIRKSHLFREAIIRTAGEGICACSLADEHPRLQFSIWNERMVEITGYTREEINDLGWQRVLFPEPELLSRALTRLAEIRMGDESRAEEWEITRKDGAQRVLSISTSLIPSEDGGPALVAVLQDVTEQKNAARAIQASEERFRHLANAIRQIVWIADPSGDVTYLNRRWTEYSGLTTCTPDDVQQVIHPDDISGVLAGWNEVLQAPRLYEFEYRMRPSTGGPYRWFMAQNVPIFDAEGDLIEWCGTATDIDDQKRTQVELERQRRELQLILDTVPALIFFKDRQQRLLRVNAEALRITGLSRTELEGRTDSEAGSPHSEQYACDDREVIESGRPKRGIVEPLTTLSGTRWLQTDKLPYRSDAGEIVGVLGFSVDITERKAAEEALRESEERHALCVRASNEGVWDYDLRSGAVWWNQTYDDLFGPRPREGDNGWNWAVERIHPEERQRVTNSLFAAIQGTADRWVGEYRFRRADGTYADVFDRAFIARDGDGKAKRMIGAMLDVTERRRAERRLATQTAVSQALAESDSLSTATPRILQALCECEAWDFGEIWQIDETMNVLRSVDVWHRPESLPTELAERTRTLTLVRGVGLPGQVWATGRLVDVADIACDRNCVRSPLFAHAGLVSAYAFPILLHGQVLGVVGFAGRNPGRPDPLRDKLFRTIGQQLGQFVERTRAQNAVRRFVSSSPVVIYAVAVDGDDFRLTWVSDNIESLTGYCAGEILESDWRLAQVHPDDRDRIRAAHALPNDFDQRTLEFRFRRKDGAYLWVRDEQRLLRDADGRPREIIGSLSDISERVHLEEQLRQAQKLEAVGKLAGGIAHDFNNLLSVIYNYSAVLTAGLPANDRLRPHVDEIRQAAERAATLTRQLVAFSRGQMLAPSVLDLNTVVTGVDKLLKRLIGDEIELTTTLAAPLCPVLVDPSRMEQVIVNLAVNARDAMPHGGRLMIETRNVRRERGFLADAEAGRYVELAVSDTGCGIPADVQSRIFEPFYSTKKAVAGSGLGLATVYGIVKQSGGHISVSSEVGVGTTFAILLPVVDEPYCAA